MAPRRATERSTDRDDTNHLVLTGRVTRAPEVKSLPSGDTLVVLRVAVARPDRSRSDSIEVAVGPPPARGQRRTPGQALTRTVRLAAQLSPGDHVHLEGHLERRFWRADGAPRTRIQVVAHELARGDAAAG